MTILPQRIFARKLFDIPWADVFRGIYFALTSSFSGADSRQEAIEKLQDLWVPTQTLVTLSVRSALDLLLQACEFAPGSEILVSAVTIPHMVSIIRLHGLVPVPIDLQSSDASVSVEDVRALIGPQTKAILVAQLFGHRHSMAALGELAKDQNLLLIEDCAQAFCGLDFKGSPEASVSMFSFGPIKTCTSFAGGVVTVRVPELLSTMREMQSGYACIREIDYLKKIFKYSAMKAVTSSPLRYGAMISILHRRGVNHHEFITKASHSLAKDTDILQQIRLNPSLGLIKLLNYRISHFNMAQLEQRVAQLATIVERLPSDLQPIGYKASMGVNTMPCHYWICPIRVESPADVLDDLLLAGFDAAAGNASLVVIPNQKYTYSHDGHTEFKISEATRSEKMMGNVIYLPIDNHFDQDTIRRLIYALKNRNRRL